MSFYPSALLSVYHSHLSHSAVRTERLQALAETMLYTAHDVKTALSVIEMSLAAIQRQDAAGCPHAPQALDVIRMALTRATALLDEVLQFGIERSLQPKPIALREVVGRVARMIGVAAAGRAAGSGPVEVNVRYEGEVPVLLGYERLLETSLINLAFNGLQALNTEGGRLDFRVLTLPGAVEIRIQDSGPGLPKVSADGRAAPYAAAPTKGTGLGLPIARAGIEAHGGRVWLRNTTGAGVEAVVVLPIGPPAQTSAPGESLDPKAATG